jgi:glutaminyl-peptide cyclotransferase
MNWKKISILAILTISITACKTDLEKFTENYALEVSNPKQVWGVGDEVKIVLKDPANMGADSVVWKQNALKIQGAGGFALSRKLTTNALGELLYEATVYKDGKMQTYNTTITRFYERPTAIYSHELVRILPHNKESYTQGIEFYKGNLYESSGQNGESALRLVNLETGETIQKTEQPLHIFSEGLTVMNDKIYQLTWQAGYGYIYDLNLKKIDDFKYNRSKEGWGLANDGNTIYKSDGSSRIWKINATTLAEEGFITVTTNKSIVPKINELEWVNGKLYANVYMQNGFIIINPESGAVEAAVDLQPIIAKEPNYTPADNVLNGIAYDSVNDKLYVTGKRWTQLFEIRIKK